MAIYELKPLRKRSDIRGRDVGRPVTEVKVLFRSPEEDESSEELKERKLKRSGERWPVHEKDIKEAELREAKEEEEE